MFLSDREITFGATPLALALHDPAEGDTGSIVDTDVDVFPARPFTAGTQVTLAGSITGDAMAYSVELVD